MRFETDPRSCLCPTYHVIMVHILTWRRMGVRDRVKGSLGAKPGHGVGAGCCRPLESRYLGKIDGCALSAAGIPVSVERRAIEDPGLVYRCPEKHFMYMDPWNLKKALSLSLFLSWAPCRPSAASITWCRRRWTSENRARLGVCLCPVS